MSAPEQAFASIRDDAGAVLAIGRLSIADGWAGITAVEVTQARRGAGLGMALTRAICAEAAARDARPDLPASGGRQHPGENPLRTLRLPLLLGSPLSATRRERGTWAEARCSLRL
jgi:hypothetical protein